MVVDQPGALAQSATTIDRVTTADDTTAGNWSWWPRRTGGRIATAGLATNNSPGTSAAPRPNHFRPRCSAPDRRRGYLVGIVIA